MTGNIILNTDSYKTSHYLQYPPGSRFISSYIEPRGGCFQQAVFFGLQMFIRAWLTQPITLHSIEEARDLLLPHGVPFNEQGWLHILHQHNGYLPIRIEAIPEGQVIPIRNALVQIVNTDPQCAWLTTYLETALLRAVWYPTTVATLSFHCRQIIARYLADTADTTDSIMTRLHDFGARGATSEESAGIGGAAHLVNFSGTDTLSGIRAAQQFYGANMPGYSIPAAEHSTITSWGKNHELDAYANMLTQFAGPDKRVAVVSDSYDLWHAIESLWGGTLKSRVQNTGGTLIIRPDSGDPVTIVPDVLRQLMATFGYRTNTKGYHVLPDYIRVIQGDGINPDSIQMILATMKAQQQSADNITFGMGGALLQRINRDTMNFAMKASAININGQWYDIYKDPVTDTTKRSKKGRLAVIADKQGVYSTINCKQRINKTDKQQDNLLQPVFENGQLIKSWQFDEIRARARLADT